MDNVNCNDVVVGSDVAAVETTETTEAFIDRAVVVAEVLANPEVGPTVEYKASEVTTMNQNTTTDTTETTKQTAETKPEKPVKAPKAPKPNNSYPFESAKQIKTRLEYDTPFALNCLAILWDRQTSHEQATKTTKNRNRRGFMSSHAVTGCNLAEKVASGEELTEEETSKVHALVSRYTKQLAEHFRDEKIAANPELEKVAAIYGV